jgi:hypothetical protein
LGQKISLQRILGTQDEFYIYKFSPAPRLQKDGGAFFVEYEIKERQAALSTLITKF